MKKLLPNAVSPFVMFSNSKKQQSFWKFSSAYIREHFRLENEKFKMYALKPSLAFIKNRRKKRRKLRSADSFLCFLKNSETCTSCILERHYYHELISIASTGCEQNPTLTAFTKLNRTSSFMNRTKIIFHEWNRTVSLEDPPWTEIDYWNVYELNWTSSIVHEA